MGLFIHNHGKTVMNDVVGKKSSVEEIKKTYGHVPFEGSGFRTDYRSEENCSVWTETRPIYYLSRKNELFLLGGVQYKVSKAYYDCCGELEAQPAHYHIRKIMSAKKYKELKNAHEAKLKSQSATRE